MPDLIANFIPNKHQTAELVILETGGIEVFSDFIYPATLDEADKMLAVYGYVRISHWQYESSSWAYVEERKNA